MSLEITDLSLQPCFLGTKELTCSGCVLHAALPLDHAHFTQAHSAR